MKKPFEIEIDPETMMVEINNIKGGVSERLISGMEEALGDVTERAVHCESDEKQVVTQLSQKL